MSARESDYYYWLTSLIRLKENHPNYTNLIKQLDSIEYVYILANDKNRECGGRKLRERYADEYSIDDDDIRSNQPSTVLEMLIAVADHMVDILDSDIERWFWVLIDNLYLTQSTDDNYDSNRVDFIIMSWMNREYLPNSSGSLFPLKQYSGDYRTLDIWSQMNAWINENYPSNRHWLDW